VINQTDEDARNLLAGAWGVVVVLYGTTAGVRLMGEKPSSAILPLWLAYVFGAIALIALYLLFAEIFFWWPVEFKGARGAFAGFVVAVPVAALVGISAFGIGNGTAAVPATPKIAPATSASAPRNPGTASPYLAATLAPPDGADLTADYRPVMSQDGKYMAAAGASPNQSSIYVWSITAGSKSLKMLSLPSDGLAIPCAFTPDDKSLVAISYVASAHRSTIYRIALSTGQGTNIDWFTSSDKIAVSGDGSTLAFVSAKGDEIDVKSLLDMGSSLGAVSLKYSGSLVPNSLQLNSDGSELIISDTKGTGYVMAAEQPEPGVDLVSTLPFDYASGNVPLFSSDGSTVIAPVSNGGWKLWSVGSLGSPPDNVTPQDSHWPQSNGSAQYSPDGSTILTWPNGGVSYDLWDETSHDYIASFQVPNSQGEYVVLLGFDGDQLVLGVGTNNGSEYTKLYVWGIRHG
jgi:hypothetical protein